MKRCPVDAGGCGELVEMLFDSGLCQKCDAQVAAGTAAAGGPVLRRGRIKELPPRTDEPAAAPCKRYLKDPTQRGICVCGAARAEHRSVKSTFKRGVTEPGPRKALRSHERNGTGGIPALRAKYETDLAEAKNRVAIIEMALTVLNDVEVALAK